MGIDLERLAMKTIALSLSLALTMCSPVPAFSIEMDGEKVVLSEEDKDALKVCKEQGGCHVWTDAEIRQLLSVWAQKVVEQVSCTRRSI